METMTAYQLLVVLAMILALLGIVRPAWPAVAVAVLLLAIALLISMKTKVG